MGEAKRRKQNAGALRTQLEEHVPRVSAAIRKLATSASSHLGTDCYVHAELGRALLQDVGIEARSVHGYAAWRIGPGSGDVISHTPREVGHLPPGAEGFAYHAWLQAFDFVIDLTTYQLERKARELDAADGGRTTVSWCPPYLLLPRHRVRSYDEVANAPGPGVCYYAVQSDVKATLDAREHFTLDPTDLMAARVILRNPQANVFGPNDLTPSPSAASPACPGDTE